MQLKVFVKERLSILLGDLEFTIRGRLFFL
jgi:hypothetical protein